MKSDPILKGIIIILLLAGFFILASASIGITTAQKLPSNYFLLRQLATGGITGLILFFMAGGGPYKPWRFLSLFFFFFLLGFWGAGGGGGARGCARRCFFFFPRTHFF